MKYRFKIEIVLDDEKIREAGEYTPESIRKAICENFELFDLPQIKTTDGSMVFGDRGRNTDLGALGHIAYTFCKANWFRPYATRFMWYERDEQGEWCEEDIFDTFGNFEVK